MHHLVINRCRIGNRVKDIKEGEEFTEENIRSIRPGYGLHPRYLSDIYGKAAKKDIEKGTPLKWNLVNL